MTICFDNRVAIVTGAATGLGRAHALGLAARGARVVVNDLGVDRDGAGRSSEAAEAVVAEIEAAGGEALAHGADVSSEAEVADMVGAAMARWGRVDILVCNAGILRDRSFAKMEMADFRKVIEVHLIGTATCARAVWPIMREAGFGRIVFTTSSSGLYGNFGQSNYAAAKAGMVGLMNTLTIEGAKNDIRVNLLSPTAATRMTEGLLPDEAVPLLAPETITPGLLWLVSDDAPSRTILCAGAGCFSQTRIYETEGVCLTGDDLSPEGVAARMAEIAAAEGQVELTQAFDQTKRFAERAARARGGKLEWQGSAFRIARTVGHQIAEVDLEPELPLELVIRGYPVSYQTKRKHALESWKEDVEQQAREQLEEGHFALQELLIATVYLFPRAPVEPDLDNAAKPILDGLSNCVYVDDRLIERLTIQRFEPGRAIAIHDVSDTLERVIAAEEPTIYIRLEAFEKDA